jgi:pimeloyl-ACP methyl ester carboxylesterase
MICVAAHGLSRLPGPSCQEHDAWVPLITMNGIELYYEVHGSGAPLVLLGGLGLDVSEMSMLTGPLAASFQVIAVDNRGAGRSASRPARTRLNRWLPTSPT